MTRNPKMQQEQLNSNLQYIIVNIVLMRQEKSLVPKMFPKPEKKISLMCV